MSNTENNTSYTQNVIKRDGAIQSFDTEKIIQAIYKAMLSVDKGSLDDAKFVVKSVLLDIEKNHDLEHQQMPYLHQKFLRKPQASYDKHVQ